MEPIKYSIVIPCYNAEKTIGESIKSIINQEYKNIELIIINDGSSDNSEAVIKQAIKDNPSFDIKYLKISPNAGPSAARNTGIDMASGDYIAFLDSDDRYDTKLFKELSEIKEEFDVCYFGWVEYNEDGTVFSQFSKTYHFLDSFISGEEAAKRKYSGWLWLCNCNEIYSLKMIKKYSIKYPVGVYSGEDTCFIYKCLAHAEKVCSLPKDYFYNYIHNTSLMHSKFNERFVTLFASIKELYEYSLNNFNEDLINIFYSLYHFSGVTIAKKISDSYKWYNGIKFSKECKKYIPKMPKERKLVLSKKDKMQLSIYNFSKPLFLLVYKIFK